MFRVIATATYLKEIEKWWDKNDRDAAEKLPGKLAESPYSGKPLSYAFLREKRIKEKRVYYLIYDDLKLVLLVAVGDKKDQHRTIEHIKDKLGAFKEQAKKLLDV